MPARCWTTRSAANLVPGLCSSDPSPRCRPHSLPASGASGNQTCTPSALATTGWRELFEFVVYSARKGGGASSFYETDAPRFATCTADGAAGLPADFAADLAAKRRGEGPALEYVGGGFAELSAALQKVGNCGPEACCYVGDNLHFDCLPPRGGAHSVAVLFGRCVETLSSSPSSL